MYQLILRVSSYWKSLDACLTWVPSKSFVENMLQKQFILCLVWIVKKNSQIRSQIFITLCIHLVLLHSFRFSISQNAGMLKNKYPLSFSRSIVEKAFLVRMKMVMMAEKSLSKYLSIKIGGTQVLNSKIKC